MIIFRGKTNQTIKAIEAPEVYVIVTQEKDESLMFIWFDQVWKSYAKKTKRNCISTNCKWYMMPSKHTQLTR